MQRKAQKDVIVVNDVSKSFKIYFDKGATLKEKLLFADRRKHEVRNVLTNINFTVKKGEVIALIGENGCGKSTLLKLLTKIMYPDKGQIRMEGRVSSLIELGAGFHPDLTGRENIYTNASIFGLSRKEIDSRIEKIIEFSELGDFINNPVRTYSSGMYMRLAFAVAINVDAEILLIDEILAVGDASFQAKCFRKIQEIKNQGVTIVFVSHDLSTVQRICDRAIYIYRGKIKREGDPYNVVNTYLKDVMENESGLKSVVSKDEDVVENEPSKEDIFCEQQKDKLCIDSDAQFISRHGNKAVEITSIKMIEASTNQEKTAFETGKTTVIRITYKRNDSNIKTCVFGIGIFRNDGIRCYGTNTQNNRLKVTLKDSGSLEIVLEEFEILPGEYWIDVALHDEFSIIYDFISGAYRFNVFSSTSDVGVAMLKHRFNLNIE